MPNVRVEVPSSTATTAWHWCIANPDPRKACVWKNLHGSYMAYGQQLAKTSSRRSQVKNMHRKVLQPCMASAQRLLAHGALDLVEAQILSTAVGAQPDGAANQHAGLRHLAALPAVRVDPGEQLLPLLRADQRHAHAAEAASAYGELSDVTDGSLHAAPRCPRGRKRLEQLLQSRRAGSKPASEAPGRTERERPAPSRSGGRW